MKLSNCFYCKKITQHCIGGQRICTSAKQLMMDKQFVEQFCIQRTKSILPFDCTLIVPISLSFITFLFYPNTCSPLAEEDLRDLLTSFHLLCSDPRVACTCFNFLRSCSQNWKGPSKILVLLCFFQKLKSTLPNEDSKRPVEDIRHRALNKT